MKFSFSWLKEHLNTTKTPEEIANALTSLGLEVENLINQADKLKGFTVAFVESCTKHPDADRLSLCHINNGSSELIQVICGAPNIKQGLKIAFAQPGCIIPSTGDVLKKGKIRGVESLGMVCSLKELGFGEESNGILELETPLNPGTPLCEYFGLNDYIFDLSITPNRADCFSVYGIARDLAAKGMGTLKKINSATSFPKNNQIDLTIHNNHAIPYFSFLKIEGVQNKPSPDWLKKRIEDAGQNSISAIVDITNFVMFDLGQPLHAFDADQTQQPFHVDLAKKGETLKALNEEEYHLENDIVVKDQKGIIALAGIKGGLNSGTYEKTQNIYLEAAYFNPQNIAQTGQKFHLFSDARARFERGIDPEITQIALQKAADLIMQVCGGQCTQYVEKGTLPKTQHIIELPINLFEQKTGQHFSTERIVEILEKLNFTVQIKNNILYVETPSHRHDMLVPENIIEEVLRLDGYDQIPQQKLFIHHTDKHEYKKDRLKSLFIQQGYDEVYTFSMIGKENALLFNPFEQLLHLEKPLTLELAMLRGSLLPSLLEVAVKNKSKSIENTAIFEHAPVFFEKENNHAQKMCFAGIRFNKNHQGNWLENNRSVDVFDIRKDIFTVLESCDISPSSIQVEQKDLPSYYHPKRSATLKQGKKILGYFGELHPKVLKQLSIKQAVVCFELYDDELPQTKNKKPQHFSPSIYQPILRDFAFIMDKHLTAEKLIQTIYKVDKNLIQHIDVFDAYEGDRIEKGKKSLALRLRVQAQDRTLTDDEMMIMQNKIIDVCRQIGAEIRQGIE